MEKSSDVPSHRQLRGRGISEVLLFGGTTVSEERMKILGRTQKRNYKLEELQGFFEMIIVLRNGKPFIPKGVHRFKTFEECDKWTLKMLTRNSHDEL